MLPCNAEDSTILGENTKWLSLVAVTSLILHGKKHINTVNLTWLIELTFVIVGTSYLVDINMDRIQSVKFISCWPPLPVMPQKVWILHIGYDQLSPTSYKMN